MMHTTPSQIRFGKQGKGVMPERMRKVNTIKDDRWLDRMRQDQWDMSAIMSGYSKAPRRNAGGDVAK